MTKEEKMYMDFRKVSAEIQFKQVLDWLNIPYKETAKEIKTENIIVSKKKNLFFSIKGNAKGSVINFLAEHRDIGLREACKELIDTFLKEVEEPKREIPELNLKYTEEVEDLGIDEQTANEYEIGKVQGRSVLSGSVAFRIYKQDNTPHGYIGYKKDKWIFPKGSKRGNIVYNLNRVETDYVILVSSILDCLHLIKIGFPYTIALMAKYATDEQIKILSRLKRILIILPDPENISQRLSKECFIKQVKKNSAVGLNESEIKGLF